MKKIFFALSIILSCCMAASAQDVKLISATSQKWTGGIPGNYGVNYTITLQSKKKISIDSVMLGNTCYPVAGVASHMYAAVNVSKTAIKGKKTQYVLNLQLNNAMRDTMKNEQPAQAAEGNNSATQARVMYHIGKKKKEVAVASFKVQPAIAYP